MHENIAKIGVRYKYCAVILFDSGFFFTFYDKCVYPIHLSFLGLSNGR